MRESMEFRGTVEERVQRLERQLRTRTVVGVILALIVANRWLASVFMDQTIEAERFVVKDDDGNAVAMMTDSDGGQVMLSGPEGEEMFLGPSAIQIAERDRRCLGRREICSGAYVLLSSSSLDFLGPSAGPGSHGTISLRLGPDGARLLLADPKGRVTHQTQDGSGGGGGS